jgi:hypothetical protein
MESEDNLIDLLEYLEKIEEDKQSSSSPVTDSYSLNKFITECNIEVGTDRIPNYLIYHKYRVLWEGQHRNNKANKIVFFRAFNKMFTQVRTGKQRYYLLNADSFDLRRENVERAKLYDKAEKERQKTLKKRKGKTSISKKGNESKE